MTFIITINMVSPFLLSLNNESPAIAHDATSATSTPLRSYEGTEWPVHLAVRKMPLRLSNPTPSSEASS